MRQCIKISSLGVRRAIPKTVRIALWENHFTDDNAKGNCNVCRCEIKISNFEAGHIVSRAKGGSDNLSNLLPLCSLCNKSMGTENLLEFKRKYFRKENDLNRNRTREHVIIEDENNFYVIQ